MSERLIDPGRKVLRWPARVWAIREGKRADPLNVEVDLTDQCNLRCAHCDFVHRRGERWSDVPKLGQALRQMHLHGLRSVTFTGGGEPTLHPAFAAAVAAAYSIGLKVGVYSNGLRPEALADVWGMLDWCYVSLDAVAALDYRRRKGVDAFTRVVKGARDLARMNTAAHHTTVGLGFLLDGEWNGAALEEAVRLRAVIAADYAQFRPIVGLPDYSWVEPALEHLDRLAGQRVYVSRDRFLDLATGANRTYDVCRGSELIPCLGADGTLWVCPNTRGLRPLGNLWEEDFADVWARRPRQLVGSDCRVACRCHSLNETLAYVCGEGPHDAFL